MDFRIHVLPPIPLSNGQVAAVQMSARSISGIAQFFCRYLKPSQMRARVARDVNGKQVWGHPMWGTEAIRRYALIQRRCPGALMLSLQIGQDKTRLSKEQSADPGYLACNNLPLSLHRKMSMIVLGLYFGHVDPSVLEGLSDEKARQVSRLIYSYGLKAWFAEYLATWVRSTT